VKMKFFIRLSLQILSIRAFSRIYGRITRMRHPRFIIRRLIEVFRDSYNITMNDYIGQTEDYKSLCDFFIRPLDPAKRPLVPVQGAVVSPADGILTEIETVYEDKAQQIKGSTYSVTQLVGENLDFTEGWHVATIYLAPSNYHRYHYPYTGTIKRYLHTGRRLYPVNKMGLKNVSRLFVRNERIVVEMDVNGMSCYAVAVGATFVGSIKMEFIQDRKKRHQWHPVDQNVSQLQEMGRFEMGSTIVLVLPKKIGNPVPETVGKPVRVGQSIIV
jgi:phosphatidylserine decarboxylase